MILLMKLSSSNKSLSRMSKPNVCRMEETLTFMSSNPPKHDAIKMIGRLISLYLLSLRDTRLKRRLKAHLMP